MPDHYRAVILVDRVDGVPPMVNALIPQWDNNTIVSFPLDLIPKPLHKEVVQGCSLLAMVNLKAKSADDLNIHNFEY